MSANLTLTDLPVADGIAPSQAQIDAALGIVQDYCGWGLVLEDLDVRVDSDGDRVLWLPSLHVADVASVELTATPEWAVRYEWSENGALSLAAAPPGIDAGRHAWPVGRRAVRVKFTSGYEKLPAAVIAVIASISTRMTEPGLVRQRSETTGGITVSESMVGSDGPGVKSLEAAALDRYRIRVAR